MSSRARELYSLTACRMKLCLSRVVQDWMLRYRLLDSTQAGGDAAGQDTLSDAEDAEWAVEPAQPVEEDELLSCWFCDVWCWCVGSRSGRHLCEPWRTRSCWLSPPQSRWWWWFCRFLQLPVCSSVLMEVVVLAPTCHVCCSSGHTSDEAQSIVVVVLEKINVIWPESQLNYLQDPGSKIKAVPSFFQNLNVNCWFKLHQCKFKNLLLWKWKFSPDNDASEKVKGSSEWRD